MAASTCSLTSSRLNRTGSTQVRYQSQLLHCTSADASSSISAMLLASRAVDSSYAGHRVSNLFYGGICLHLDDITVYHGYRQRLEAVVMHQGGYLCIEQERPHIVAEYVPHHLYPVRLEFLDHFVHLAQHRIVHRLNARVAA